MYDDCPRCGQLEEQCTCGGAPQASRRSSHLTVQSDANMSHYTERQDDTIVSLARRVSITFNEPASIEAQRAAARVAAVPTMSGAEVVDLIQRDVIGSDVVIPAPFGERLLVYADYTASGRALRLVEDYIREVVLPMYANTHTEASATGLQTGHFREEARDLVARSVNAPPDCHVIFCGSGSTAAINKMVRLLGFERKRDVTLLEQSISEDAECLPVVFVSPFEHHSNDLPWREVMCELHTIPENDTGLMDLEYLDRSLHKLTGRPMIICSISAASNVTGIITDVAAVSAICRKHGAKLFCDFAACAPYVKIDMRLIDAAFISPHKMVGGPSTPGVLVARSSVLDPRKLAEFHSQSTHQSPKVCVDEMCKPTDAGGGTVNYVSPHGVEYTNNLVAREEGGTPAIVDSIRCGLCFMLKDKVTTERIHELEAKGFAELLKAWKDAPIIVLGPVDCPRVCIVSFLISTRTGKYLHHNFVVAVLNDVFGVQSRGGCSCAGPYGHRLLSVNMARTGRIHEEYKKYGEGIKPGWPRINLNFFISAAERNYILSAVRLVALHGWKLLPAYNFNIKNGQWMRDGWEAPVLTFKNSRSPKHVHSESTEEVLSKQLKLGEELLTKWRGSNARYCSEHSESVVTRWWAEPADFTGRTEPRTEFILPRGAWLHREEDIPGPVKQVAKFSTTSTHGGLRTNIPDLAFLSADSEAEDRVMTDPSMRVSTSGMSPMRGFSAASPKRGGSPSAASRSTSYRAPYGGTDDDEIGEIREDTSQAAGRVSLQWTGITAERAEAGGCCGASAEGFCVRNAHGKVPYGSVCGVLSPDPAERLALLEILAGRREPDAGAVQITYEVPRQGDQFAGVAYVPPGEVYTGPLTVLEAVQQAALLSGAAPGRQEAEGALLKAGLLKKRDEPAAMLPPGDRRLLGVAAALTGGASLVILGDILEGLSKRDAAEVAQELSSVAKTGTIVVLSLGHVGSRSTAALDRVCVLGRGVQVYFGSAVPGALVDGLAEQKKCPGHIFAFDHALSLAEAAEAPAASAQKAPAGPQTGGASSRRAGWCTRAGCVGLREVHTATRTPWPLVSIAVRSVLALLLGFAYWDVGNEASVVSRQLRVSFAFALTAFTVLCALAEVPTTCAFFQETHRERAHGLLGGSDVALARWTVRLPLTVLTAVAISVCAILPTGLDKFGLHLFTVFVLLMAAESGARLISSAVQCSARSLLVALGTFLVLLLVTGYLVPEDDTNPVYIWMHYCAFPTYAFRAIVYHEFKDLPPLQGTAHSAYHTSRGVLERFEAADPDAGACCLILAAFAVFFTLCDAVLLTLRRP
eukprot:TRINITY_DN587_c1_g1_i1.p1 TRINITY_DN587_c1_g1~~TRINITY_DN587_c1_g1_i1.p1  ORF type:complete len:1318 (+),score=331.74 TRINITY_DN587_c1_g1_i1:78-4031(+)